MGAISIPAPVGGWNASDAIDKMPATDAVRLVNWIPRAGWVESRKGSAQHCAGLGGPVRTLAAYGGSAVLIAGANGRLWNVTTSTPASLATGFTDDNWQTAQHTGRLILTNGANAPQVFDGTTVAAANFTGSPAGFVATTMWGCNTFKGRVWYWARNQRKAWYAAAGSFQGVMAEFDFGPNVAGTLVQMLSITMDSGTGVDDFAAFIFSTGEVLLYQGDDPGAAAAWSLVGKFQVGEPLGVRAHARVGSTEIVLTRDGYVDIMVALRDGRYSEKSAYSAKIIQASKAAAAEFGLVPRSWECHLYPAGNLFIVNIPTGLTTSYQHVRETSSGGWCEFAGWHAMTMTVWNNRLYFGTEDGRVLRADVGTSDEGVRIECYGIPAFNSLGNRAQKKQLTAVNVISTALRPSSYAVDGMADFRIVLRSTLPDDPGLVSAAWDVDPWDDSSWAVTDVPATGTWRNCSAIGYVVTAAVRIRQRAQLVRWYSTQIQYRPAGTL